MLTVTSRDNILQQPMCSTSPISLSNLVVSAFGSPSEICSACQQPILEQYFLVLESRPYHSHCLRCALCHCGLSYETSCYVKNGLILCRKDYTAKFRRSCAKCHVTLECDDIVMRARDAVFHVQCFCCAVCGIQPNVGDIFAMTRHFEILCQVHYDIPQMDEPPSIAQSLKRKDDSDEPEDYAEDEQPSHSRSKRMRTSFKHHQLRTMKQYFNLNHNPDAKDLKQLAQKTGLTKRVLQVWFQNARAKYRRSMHGSDGATISPLTVVSTNIHDCQNESPSRDSSEA